MAGQVALLDCSRERARRAPRADRDRSRLRAVSSTASSPRGAPLDDRQRRARPAHPTPSSPRHGLGAMPVFASHLVQIGARALALEFPHARATALRQRHLQMRARRARRTPARAAGAHDRRRRVRLLRRRPRRPHCSRAVALLAHCARRRRCRTARVADFAEALARLARASTRPATGAARAGPTRRPSMRDRRQLLADEARYCSFGDTVHYAEPPKIFERCEGSYMYDAARRALSRPADVVLGRQLRLRQPAPERRAQAPARHAAAGRQPVPAPREDRARARSSPRTRERKWDRKGRVHFNVGGAQAIEDSLKLVRNASGGKSLMFAFEGGYHGRTLGASAITSSYRYRRRYGHFGDRAQFVPFPYHFRGPKGMSKEEYGEHCVQPVRAPVRDRIQRRLGPQGRRRPSTPPSTSSRSRAPAATSSRRRTSSSS